MHGRYVKCVSYLGREGPILPTVSLEGLQTCQHIGRPLPGVSIFKLYLETSFNGHPDLDWQGTKGRGLLPLYLHLPFSS